MSKLQAAIGWSTLVVVLCSSVALGANRPAYWFLLAATVLVLFCVQTIVDLVEGLPKTASRLWLPALVFFSALAWALVQTLPSSENFAHPVWDLVSGATPRISADPIAGHHVILRLASYSMVFWVAFRSSARTVRTIAFLKSIALYSTVMAGFGLFAHVTGTNPITRGGPGDALSATFINRNSYATFAVFGILANLGVYIHASRHNTPPPPQFGHKVRNFLEQFFGGAWVYAFGFLLCLAGLVLTQSRAGGLAGIAGLATFAAVYRRKAGRPDPFLMAIVIAILAFVLTVLSTGLFARLLATTEEESRFVIYGRVLDGILDRPFLGHGLGAFADAFRPYVPIELAQSDWDMAHNSYLENAFEMGVPAALLFYISLLIIVTTIGRGAMIRQRNRVILSVTFSVAIAAGLHAIFDFSLQIPAIASLFAYFLGIGYAHSFRSAETRNE